MALPGWRSLIRVVLGSWEKARSALLASSRKIGSCPDRNPKLPPSPQSDFPCIEGLCLFLARMACPSSPMRIGYTHNFGEAATMHQIYDTQAPKKPTNVSINSDLLEKARSLGINLSASLESILAEQVRAEQRTQWQQENTGAIQAYNQFVEENGTFGDSARKF
ncbi:hypothetical protein L861_10320 [Litchfieldella anticariensis FP35 = DSM 16096]|uniref:Acetoacetyl-CoA synthase n=1 Tax=Litchfieldella anticariensis (strain DSM 16096 / CECT 5854 / CIP 108499 / LMG 22089 / FP35) TaxID=1121939 RepID=S2LD53_LITA3|nr:hypothetical protein L861_10320 [Halomonas anticariensis FP35 = DSM 16096]